MKLKDAMANIQYDPNWQIWAKGIDPEAKAKYVQRTDRTEVLAEQGYRLIGNGESIGDYIGEYCEGIPEEERKEFVEEAVEWYLEELREWA